MLYKWGNKIELKPGPYLFFLHSDIIPPICVPQYTQFLMRPLLRYLHVAIAEETSSNMQCPLARVDVAFFFGTRMKLRRCTVRDIETHVGYIMAYLWSYAVKSMTRRSNRPLRHAYPDASTYSRQLTLAEDCQGRLGQSSRPVPFLLDASLLISYQSLAPSPFINACLP